MMKLACSVFDVHNFKRSRVLSELHYGTIRLRHKILPSVIMHRLAGSNLSTSIILPMAISCWIELLWWMIRFG